MRVRPEKKTGPSWSSGREVSLVACPTCGSWVRGLAHAIDFHIRRCKRERGAKDGQQGR